jgi:hypothetical protein
MCWPRAVRRLTCVLAIFVAAALAAGAVSASAEPTTQCVYDLTPLIQGLRSSRG